MTKITTLRDTVRDQLINRPDGLTLKQIAKETGLKFGWLQSFLRSECENPGVVSVETLHVYLIKKGGNV